MARDNKQDVATIVFKKASIRRDTRFVAAGVASLGASYAVTEMVLLTGNDLSVSAGDTMQPQVGW